MLPAPAAGCPSSALFQLDRSRPWSGSTVQGCVGRSQRRRVPGGRVRGEREDRGARGDGGDGGRRRRGQGVSHSDARGYAHRTAPAKRTHLAHCLVVHPRGGLEALDRAREVARRLGDQSKVILARRKHRMFAAKVTLYHSLARLCVLLGLGEVASAIRFPHAALQRSNVALDLDIRRRRGRGGGRR